MLPVSDELLGAAELASVKVGKEYSVLQQAGKKMEKWIKVW